MLLFALALGFLGCEPQIGDECEASGQCPPGAYCDNTVPDGYCIIENCKPGTCPEDSTCVEFAPRQTYCMRSCEADDECRSGHTCIREAGETRGYCFIES